tara:strand:+ start:347 stop:670 length:324 start_codon:yes stop_codon:yes gene_type:complete
LTLNELKSALNHVFWKDLNEGTKLVTLLYDLPKNENAEDYNFNKCEDTIEAKKSMAYVVSKNLREEMIKRMDNLISVHSLLCLGFLWCQGSNKDKAQALFWMINPPW